MQEKIAPTVKPNWIGGHFRQFRKNPIGFIEMLASLGDVASFKMGKMPAYLVNHPDLVRDILVVNAHKFVKGRALQRAKNLLGEGLLTSEKEFHLRQRRLAQPAFHRARIAIYAKAMIDYGEKMSSDWKDGEELDVSKEMMRLTLWIVGKTLFSADVEADAEEVGEVMTTLVEMFDLLLMPFSEYLEMLPLPSSRKLRNARTKLDEIIYGFIRERRKNGEDKGDLLSMLLLATDEDGSQMTDKQVRDECLTIFLAGHETTANALTWTWYLLSQHPEIEAKFHAEIDAVLGNRTAVPEDYPNLKYTEQIFAESMRLYPPAWTVGRLADEDHELDGYKIAKGSLILTPMYIMHRDKRFWSNADEFKPERWETQSIKEASNKFIYFPFGGGVRRCIGEQFAWMEGVLLLATLGKRWKLKLSPNQKIALQPLITLRPKYGMKMQIEKRNQQVK
jgi:cytochrome P450